MADTARLNHVVIAEDALPGAGQQERLLALNLRDDGDSGVVTGVVGSDVLMTATPWPADRDPGGMLICEASGDEVRCRAADGRNVEATVLPRQADVFDRGRGVVE